MSVNVLDPEIPALASNAAVELDLLINDEPTDLEAACQLGERLNKSLDKSTPSLSAHGLHVGTETETILGHVFITTQQANPATILSELASRTKAIAQQLSSDDLKTREKSALESPRAFCLALSRLASAYRQSILEARPYHPFRR